MNEGNIRGREVVQCKGGDYPSGQTFFTMAIHPIGQKDNIYITSDVSTGCVTVADGIDGADGFPSAADALTYEMQFDDYIEKALVAAKSVCGSSNVELVYVVGVGNKK
jgi:hypothetical protein